MLRNSNGRLALHTFTLSTLAPIRSLCSYKRMLHMPVVKINPTDAHKVPYNTDEERATTFMDEINITAATAELLEELGAPLEVSTEDLERETALIDAAIRGKKAQPLRTQVAATAAKAFLQHYGQNLAIDVAQARAAITHKLMEIANCGDTKYELKALELLGKHSDIGIFTERSEVTINYKDPADLENAIKSRIKRLLNAEVIDVTPIGMDLDEELGVADIAEGEFSEVEQPEEENSEDGGE